MFDLLKKYSKSQSFRFKQNDDLHSACSAPTDCGGVYLVYELSKGTKNLIYVGSSGHITNEGKMRVRKSGGGGLKGRIVMGHQFKDVRLISWPQQMKIEGIKELEIIWVVTHNLDYVDSPCYIEHCLLHEYFTIHGRLPKWNKKF